MEQESFIKKGVEEFFEGQVKEGDNFMFIILYYGFITLLRPLAGKAPKEAL